LPSITGGFANWLTFTGWAFSGGSAAGDFPAFGFAAEGVWVAVGVVVAVGGSLDLFSLLEGTGVADVNALDCAQDGSANKKTTAMATARRFIFVESLSRSSKLKPTITLIRTPQGAQVLTRRFEIGVTQAVSFRYISHGRYQPIAGLL
jgi:hypothetical protein